MFGDSRAEVIDFSGICRETGEGELFGKSLQPRLPVRAQMMFSRID